MTVARLAFVIHSDQATWLAGRWDDGRAGVLVCLDEALFPASDAARLLGPKAEVVGLSQFGLSARSIVDEALSLADDFFPSREAPWPARVERWLIESLRRWLIYAVHSVRAVLAALERFDPAEVWVPPHPPLRLTTTPDQDAGNPLFFDVLVTVARRQGVAVLGACSSHGRWRVFTPLKYVLGQWLARRPPRAPGSAASRPVLVSNFDNDFHRQFDPARLGSSASLMLAWIRAAEGVVPVETLLAEVGVPPTTRLDWLRNVRERVARLTTPAGARPRVSAGLRYLAQAFLYGRRERRRRRRREVLPRLPWWDLLFGSGLPSIHAECRLAAAYYCVLEYERARTVLRRWSPRLFVAGGDHWGYRPLLAAARDLAVPTLTTASCISFLKDDFVERPADVLCVYGPAEAARFREQDPDRRILEAGDVLSTSSGVDGRVPGRRVLIATSARPYGWWFGSLLIDARTYVAALEALAAGLRRLDPPAQVLIKSHPLHDLHLLYDRIVAASADLFLGHRPEPIPVQEAASFSAAVVMSAATTFTGELIRAGVPVVFYTGALTAFGRGVVEREGLLEAATPAEVVRHLTRLLEDDAFRREAVARGDAFLRRYVADGSRSFSWVLEQLLGDREKARG